MPNPPRRARFQVHLSTAIVLVFTAGALLWTNVDTGTKIVYGHPPYEYKRYGWPLPTLPYINEIEILPFDEHMNAAPPVLIPMNFFIFIDAAVAFLILFSVWYACEWLIRRRALKKGA